jgi:DNA (cytosine-5)-methyltransferase 1
MRPRYVLLENVEGIITAKTGDGESVLKYVLGDLEERGYSCAWGIFSASEVGAPHQRKRVFILANRNSSGSGEDREPSELRTSGTEQSPSNSRYTTTSEGSEGRQAELEDTTSTGLEGTTRQSVQRRSERLTSTDGEKLGNTSSVGSCGGSTDENGQQSEVSRPGLESTEVGNAQHDGSSTTTHRKGINQTSYRSEERKDNTSESSGTSRREVVRGLYKTQYPARPREEQHEWEEPRTTITELGGTANGTSYRVDRLRLLGNGVVPDTCELAFNTLIQQL